MEKDIWSQALKILSEDMPEENFELWLKPIKPISLADGKFKIAIPNTYFKEQIDNHYKPAIEKVLTGLLNSQVELEYVVDSSIKDIFIQKVGELKSKLKQVALPPSLNPKYTFENFVVGESNRFAHAASWAVAENPGAVYNPLFIYGGVGLGKTHLIHAIGSRVFSSNPSIKIVYVSSEQFTYEFIDSIKYDQGSKFKEKYRNIHLLLVDDVQFFAGKEQTQDEFFHTFNALYEQRKQIVLSSDRTPKEIPTLEERLRSRFESGLMTDIQPPSLETRIAILKKITENEGVNVPEEVFLLIAEKIKTNIRELEGAMIRIVAYSVLKKVDIDIDIAKIILKDIIEKRGSSVVISINTIQEKTAKYFNIPVSDIKTKKRNASTVLPRHIAMYLCREFTNSSLPEIGREFGGKDHTTVIHAYNKIKRQVQYDDKIKSIINNLSTKIAE
jgi:chromosomal replication initiator protein